VVLVTSEQWHLGFLGCYGAEWIETPEFDQWALDSVVFDQHFAADLTRGAQHSAWLQRSGSDPSAWLTQLRRSGVQTTLVQSAEYPLSLTDEEVDVLHTISIADTLSSKEAPAIPELLARARRIIASWRMGLTRPELLWIHLPALPLDLPSPDYEEIYADDAESQTPLTAEEAFEAELIEQATFVPQFWRRKRSSPQDLASAQLERSSWQSTTPAGVTIDWRTRRNLYASQVTQWDRWIGKLWKDLAAIQKSGEVLTVFTAAAGLPLGEQPDLPEPDRIRLRDAAVHVPLIIQARTADLVPGRVHQLTQAGDIPATVRDWLQVDVTDVSAPGSQSLLPCLTRSACSEREELLLCCGDDWMLRTGEFALLREQTGTPDDNHQEYQLFAKPEDAWDVEDVQRQFPEVFETLSQRLQTLVAGQTSAAQPVSD